VAESVPITTAQVVASPGWHPLSNNVIGKYVTLFGQNNAGAGAFDALTVEGLDESSK
jgi:hypothetical protein